MVNSSVTKRIRLLLALAILMTVFGCGRQNAEPDTQELVQAKSIHGEQKKKVVFLMVDSLMAQAIDEGMERNELPAFRYLIEHGQYYKDVVSSFPTMSVTIDSSLITGAYPDGHHVPGLTWYSSKDRKVINYGTGPMEIVRHGISPVLTDALVELNGSHLNGEHPTIYEDLARLGLKSGSINGLIYRGTKDHTLSIPAWMGGAAALPRTIPVKGPDLLALGSLSEPFQGVKDLPDGLTRRLGFNNTYAIEAAAYLMKANKLPDFLYVYLPELDKELHKEGPPGLRGVIEVDRQIQTLFQAFGSPEEALRNIVFIITGDSGVTSIRSGGENPVIDLPSFFQDERVLRPGEAVSEQTDIVLAVNETMAYVYKLHTDKSLRDIANRLRSDARIDFISWKEGDWIYAVQGDTSKELRFQSKGELTDPYDQKWSVEQAAEGFDLKIDAANHTIKYGKYPDVLRRISGALDSHTGDFLIVAAKSGYELADRSSPTHEGGGGHGSLREQESLVPLIISGTDQKPQHLRIVDLKSFLIQLLTTK